MSSAPAAAPPFEHHRRTAASSTVFKSGPLFISSKGIGWKSWKKRWFILTRTSLVFFKNDPSALPQRGGEVNLTLGGIDLNNSGSVVVREDKKLLTVLFPDGRDGRAFTLKAETSEDLFEWKTALELALAQAPNAALVMGHNGIFRNDNADTFEGSIQTWRDKRPIKSLVVGRPILLALEDIDGGPSFLEKALCFLEKYGIKVEGILRQSADVEEVDRRVKEYEQGRTEFTSDEDAHVVGDCVKHVLRELPSSPVPASCCTALLESYKHKEARVNAMRSAITETFPEPNRRLLQRILKMMHTIAAHTAENRMTASAVAACMAPLLLRPLLAGECELEDDFDMTDDSSAQLMAAANAANNAQAIVTTLLEEYENIFDDDTLHRCSFSPDSQIDESGSEESTDDDKLDANGNGYLDLENEIDLDMSDDRDRVLSGKLSESSGYAGSDLYDYKVSADSDTDSPKDIQALAKNIESNQDSQAQYSGNGLPNANHENSLVDKDAPSALPVHESTLSMGEILSSLDTGIPFPANINEYCVEKNPNKVNGSNSYVKRSNFWGRNSAKKNRSVESVDSSGEEELAIQRLEITKNDLRMRIAKEAKGNAILQASLERRKQALHERRLALEQDVSRLQEQLQAERDLRAALEVGLSISSGQFSSSRNMDTQTRAELEEIALAEADVARLKQKVAELHLQLNQQRHDQCGSFSDDCSRYQHLSNHLPSQKAVQQDFDLNLAHCNHEKKQRSEESSSGADWRNIKPQVHPYAGIEQLAHKRSLETGFSESSGISLDPNSTSTGATISKQSAEAFNSTQRQLPAITSSTLVELTTRLDFFKERRSQLMEQLHNLDLNHGAPSFSQGSGYRSPPWNNGPR
ncbi:rho GTPase-activating protein 7-like isoform X2 [Asparagus officinalis]|uniref:rho GTPase-activating protein 7-like isoform X2 n=1 Tax=Asparagus officinalis TaxID=4686 RepID=UPI00098E005B|nr:rho GTPase-activating protein 7-like isoform X2 [Asparagus officinalis]